MRIAIVGAGLGGVAVASGLHRAGHEVTLFESGPVLREKGTGIVVMPNGQRALDRLGMPGAASSAVPAGRAGLRDRLGRALLVTDAIAAQHDVGVPAVVDRAELHRTLRAALPAEAVRTGIAVDGVGPDATVRSGGETVAKADVLIVADGVASRLRGQLFPEHPGTVRTGRMDVRGVLPRPPGMATSLLACQLVDRRTGAMFGLFPMDGDELYWFTDSVLPDRVPSTAEARELMLDLTSDWHPLVAELIASTPVEHIHVDPITCLAEPLRALAVDRTAVLGDAAHAMPPDLGQGASQAFEDAEALVRHLDGASPADVAGRLRRYDAERGPRTARMLRAARRQSRLTSRTGAAAWLRDVALRAVPPRVATRRLAALWKV